MSDDQIQVPFAGGPNETIDPRHLPPGSIIDLRNVSYDAEGQYQLRFGYLALGTFGQNPTTIRRLHNYQNDLLANDGLHLWSWNDRSSVWASKDILPPFQVRHAPIQNSTSDYQSWAEASDGNVRIVAWVDVNGSQVRASVYSVATGALVLGPTTLAQSAALNVFVGVVGTTAVLVHATSTPTIVGYTLDLTNIPSGWTAGTGLQDANLTRTDGLHCVAFLSSTFVCIYQNGANGAGQQLRMRSFNTSLTLQQNVLGTSTGLNGIACLHAKGNTSDNLWIAVGSETSGAAVVMVVNPTSLAATAGPLSASISSVISGLGASFALVIQCAVERISSTAAIVIWDLGAGNGGTGPWMLTWSQFTTAGEQSSTKGGAAGARLASAPAITTGAPVFSNLNYVLMFVRTGGDLAPNLGTYHLIAVPLSGSQPIWLGSYAPLIANAPSFTTSFVVSLPSLVPVLTDTFETVLPITRAAQGRQGLDTFVVDVQAAGQWQQASLGRELYLGASYYDGRQAAEAGYPQAPQTRITANAAGNVSYQYATTWARVDNQGNLEESAPSQFVTLTSTAPPNVACNSQCLHITQKQKQIGAESTAAIYQIIYRTPDLSKGDTTLYRVTKEPFPTASQNLLTAGSVVVNDTLSDASLTDGTHPALYTVSGELQHGIPESFVATVSHKNRIWGIGADQRTVWYSQTYSDGVLPAWNGTQTFTVDDTNETLIALASLYDKLLIFTQKRIYVVFGDGPSPAGTGSDLTVPQRVASGVGCTDPRSIVNTPEGVFFQSFRGIERIASDLTVDFVGLPVSVTTKNFPVCTSAVLCPNTSTVRWTFVQNEGVPNTGTGRIVVYDLRRQRWSFYSLTGGGSRTSAVDAPVQAGVYHNNLGYVTAWNDNVAGAVIARETTASDSNPWLDLAQYPVTLSVTTAWVKSGDLQGWQRVRRLRLLGQYYDHHSIGASFDYNYQAVGESHPVSNAVIDSINSGGWEQVRFVPGRGKSESFRATFTMTPVSGTTGRGGGLTGMALEVHRKRGGFRNLGASAKL